MKTDVILKLEGRDAVAFFPGDAGTNNPATCSCYAHVGQHGSACTMYARDLPPLAVEDPRAVDLMRELAGVGYDLKVVRRFTRRHYVARREQVRT